MEHLKFNLYALAQPKSSEDFSALLDEALLMADQLNSQLFDLEKSILRQQEASRRAHSMGV